MMGLGSVLQRSFELLVVRDIFQGEGQDKSCHWLFAQLAWDSGRDPNGQVLALSRLGGLLDQGCNLLSIGAREMDLSFCSF